MKKYNINENQPELNAEQVEKGMDFNKVKANAAKLGKWSFVKKTVIASGSAAALVTALLIYSGSEKNPIENGKADLSNATSQDQLNTDANKPTDFVIDPTRDTSLIYATGSVLNIPASVFVNEKGETIKTRVTLKYREFHNPGEIILSNIPMTYDSAGNEFHFESAGMFEITAAAENETVKIKEGKAIEVKMATLDKNTPKFNQYQLDKSGNWNYKQKDAIQAVSTASLSLVPQSNSPDAPVAPKEENSKNHQFTIDVDKKEFPELEFYENVVFEASPENKSFDPAMASVNWTDVKLERVSKKGNYKITFARPDKEFSVIAYPVVSSADYKSSMKAYEKLYALYKSKHESRLAKEKAEEEKRLKEIARQEEILANYRALQQRNFTNQLNVSESEQVLFRTFQVQQFGVWNSDYPCALPQQAFVIAEFTNENGEKLKPASVFLVEKGRNAVYSLRNSTKIQFNPEADNVLIVITNDNTLAYYSSDRFAQIPKKGSNFTFKLATNKKEKYSPSDINALL